MSNPELDRKLAEYLAACERDRDEGHTVANLRLDMHQFRTELNELSARVTAGELRQDRHGREIRAIKKRLDDSFDDVDTGVHQVEDLRKHLHQKELAQKETELQQRRDSVMWWKRKRAEWLVAAVGAGALLMIGAAGTVTWFFVTHVVMGGK